MEPANRHVTNMKLSSEISGCQWGSFLRKNIWGWQAKAPAPHLAIQVVAKYWRILHTAPQRRRSTHSEPRNNSASRKTTGMSQRSLVSRVVMPASE